MNRTPPLGLRYTCTSYERRPMPEAHRQMVYGPIESDLPPSDAWNWTDTALVIAIIATVAVCVWGVM